MIPLLEDGYGPVTLQYRSLIGLPKGLSARTSKRFA